MIRGGPATVSIRLAVLLPASLVVSLSAACGRTDLDVSVALPIVDASLPDVKDSAPVVDTSRPPAPCVPGEQVACVCPGGASGVKDCVADGGGFGACHGCPDLDASPPPKDAGNDAACTPGTVDCAGGQPEICTAAGQWQLEAGCGDGTPFCFEGTCVACSPGTTQCEGNAGNTGEVQVCSATGSWEPGTACAQPRPDCSAGACACLETECASGCVNVKTDSHNCGACGHDCLGGGCSDGFCQPIVLASKLGQPSGIASDGAFVYWTDAETGTVEKVPVGGGAVTTLASGRSLPIGIGVDSQSVYWVDRNAGVVARVALSGGVVTTLAATTNAPIGVAIDATNVYWLTTADTVMSVPIGGGQSTTLAVSTLAPNGIAADGVNVYWTGQSTAEGGAGGAVFRVPRTGGTVTTLATESLTIPMGIAASGGNAYWTSQDPAFELPLDSTVSTVPTTGGATLVLASGESEVNNVAFDGTSVFWTNNDFGSSAADSSIERLLLGTTTPTAAAQDQTLLLCLAVDSLRVYWGAYGDNPPQTGTILTVAK